MIAAAPLWLPVAWLLDRAHGRSALLATLCAAQTWLLLEVAGVAVSFWIWLTAGGGQRAASDPRNGRLQDWWAGSAVERQADSRWKLSVWQQWVFCSSRIGYLPRGTSSVFSAA